VKSSIAIAKPATGEEEWLAIREPLENGWLTQGPKVAEFERAFAVRHNVAHALATTSCTTALHLALAAAGVGPGDEVIVPAFTWVATANAAAYCGATPVFVDVEAETYNIDPAAISAAVTDRTRAAIPVHLFGLCADVDAVRAALPDGAFICEDAACAAGAELGGRSAGTLGDAAAFSFHPRKVITTGEGGMVTTDDPELARHAEILRNHGAHISEEKRHASARPHEMPEFDEVGFNYRMTDLQAAVGTVQLGKLDAFLAERDQWARWYTEQLGGLEWLAPPPTPADGTHGWQSYVATVRDDAPVPRDELMDRLQEAGIATRPGTHCVPSLGAWRDATGAFPVAEMLERQTIALPLHNRMTSDDYARVVDALSEF
jgi:dTDP-4-amino-4,6-dideoxygalactose transaminase